MSKNQSDHFAEPPIFDPEEFKTVSSPPGDSMGFWAGAPSVTKDEEGGIWLAQRLRNPDERGYEIQILHSDNGEDFDLVHSLKKDSFYANSLERPVLFRNPWSGNFELYLSIDAPHFRWHIVRLEEEKNPKDFDPTTAQVVLRPSGQGSDSNVVKDPYIISVARRLYMFYIGWDETGEQAHMATSVNGKQWKKSANNPVLQRSGWHDGLTRISCVMPKDNGFVVFYEGTSRQAFWNLRTGLAMTLNFKEFTDLTPNGPILSSPTSGKLETLRYLDYVKVGEKIYFYYEAARPDDALELRVSTI